MADVAPASPILAGDLPPPFISIGDAIERIVRDLAPTIILIDPLSQHLEEASQE